MSLVQGDEELDRRKWQAYCLRELSLPLFLKRSMGAGVADILALKYYLGGRQR